MNLENIYFFVNERRSDQITLMDDNSKNSGKKNVKSNRFLRADEQAQSIKNLFDLNVKRSSQNQFLKNILNMLKNLA